MTRLSSDELRDAVLAAMKKAKGNRKKAAEILGVSERTLARYIHDLDLFAELDKLGLIAHAGPVRNAERGSSRRRDAVIAHIKKHKGRLNYGELTLEIYGQDTEKTRQRLYSALDEFKSKGVIASDGVQWFVIA